MVFPSQGRRGKMATKAPVGSWSLGNHTVLQGCAVHPKPKQTSAEWKYDGKSCPRAAGIYRCSAVSHLAVILRDCSSPNYKLQEHFKHRSSQHIQQGRKRNTCQNWASRGDSGIPRRVTMGRFCVCIQQESRQTLR